VVDKDGNLCPNAQRMLFFTYVRTTDSFGEFSFIEPWIGFA
jgi:hypothetical protein